MTALAVAAALALPGFAPQALAQHTTRAFTNVKGDVWRFQNNFHFSVVVETADGVVVTDPINAEAAEWLKAEIASRFGKPITRLV